MIYWMAPRGHQVVQFFAREGITRAMDEVLVVGFLKFQPIDMDHWERSKHCKKERITIMDVLNMYVH
jgi:hypothetical protein